MSWRSALLRYFLLMGCSVRLSCYHFVLSSVNKTSLYNSHQMAITPTLPKGTGGSAVIHRCNLVFIPRPLKLKTLNLTQVGVFPKSPVFNATVDLGSGPENVRWTSTALFLGEHIVHRGKTLLLFSLLPLL